MNTKGATAFAVVVSMAVAILGGVTYVNQGKLTFAQARVQDLSSMLKKSDADVGYLAAKLDAAEKELRAVTHEAQANQDKAEAAINLLAGENRSLRNRLKACQDVGHDTPIFGKW